MPEPTASTRAIIRNMLVLRRQRGWSARQLADQLTAAGYAISQQALAKQETGQIQHITVDQLFALAQVFGVPIEALTNTTVCPVCRSSPPTGFRCRTFESSVRGPDSSAPQ